MSLHSNLRPVIDNIDIEEQLAYYDGPILFTFRDNAKSLMLALALDGQGVAYRFVFSEITEDFLALVKLGKDGGIPIRKFFDLATKVFVVSLSEAWKVENIELIENKHAIAELLPPADVYLDR